VTQTKIAIQKIEITRIKVHQNLNKQTTKPFICNGKRRGFIVYKYESYNQPSLCLTLPSQQLQIGHRFKGGIFKGKAAGVGAPLFRDIPTLC
jgi:hypothetical protein